LAKEAPRKRGFFVSGISSPCVADRQVGATGAFEHPRPFVSSLTNALPCVLAGTRIAELGCRHVDHSRVALVEQSVSMKRREFLYLVPAVFVAGCGKQRRLAALPAGSHVLAFGDSVTFGTGAAPGEDWPMLLAGMTGWNIRNAGLPGDTAGVAAARLVPLLEEPAPALVIITIGGNDFLRRRPPNEVKEDIRRMIRSSRAVGAQVVLLGVPELSLLAVVAGRPADSPIYAQLAREEGVLLIPDVFSNVLGQPDLCADRIHPNAQGYRQMAGGILEGLRTSGLAAGS
jgi:acyl-CoA hydrolase